MPGRLKLRTTGEQHQDGGRGCLVEHQVQQFQGRGVRPVQVFQDEEHRLMFSKFQEDRDDGFEGLLALTLWVRDRAEDSDLQEGKRQQRRKQRHRFLDRESILAQRLFEFPQFLVRGLLGLEPQ